MMTHYEIILYWSEEDRAFLAEVPELPGCMADSHTRQAAIANIERGIEEWIQAAQLLDRTIPQPKGRLLYA